MVTGVIVLLVLAAPARGAANAYMPAPSASTATSTAPIAFLRFIEHPFSRDPWLGAIVCRTRPGLHSFINESCRRGSRGRGRCCCRDRRTPRLRRASRPRRRRPHGGAARRGGRRPLRRCAG